MADGDRGVRMFALLAKNGRHRFTNNIPPAENNHFSSFCNDLAANKELLNSSRSAWSEAAGVSQHQLANIHRMEAIHILARQHGLVDLWWEDSWRKRRLHQNAMN